MSMGATDRDRGWSVRVVDDDAACLPATSLTDCQQKIELLKRFNKIVELSDDQFNAT